MPDQNTPSEVEGPSSPSIAPGGWTNVVICVRPECSSSSDPSAVASNPLPAVTWGDFTGITGSADQRVGESHLLTSLQPGLTERVVGFESDRRLDRLLAYTTFHIGMYATIFTAVVGYLRLVKDVTPLMSAMLAVSAGALLVAGAAGGIIAGNLPHFRNYEHFLRQKLSPRILEYIGVKDKWTYEWLSLVEHTAFWVAVIIISVTLLFRA